jgi:hypothetical protein
MLFTHQLLKAFMNNIQSNINAELLNKLASLSSRWTLKSNKMFFNRGELFYNLSVSGANFPSDYQMCGYDVNGLLEEAIEVSNKKVK